MTNSMTDALERIAQRMPRVVREHEVLRVAGWMPGENPADVAGAAIKEVLKWAQKRSGGQLPTEAWKYQSFNYFSGGRNSSCVRLLAGASDLWAIRADDPDKTVPGRIWTTEVVVGVLPDQPAKFSARLLVSTSEGELKIDPATPGFVKQVAENVGLVTGSQKLALESLEFETGEDANDLVDLLTDPKRQLPVFVVTLPENGSTEHPTIDTMKLASVMLGIGHVVVVHPEAAWGLTRDLGKFRSVFGGAARVYMPGFAVDADPFTHRLVLANQLATPEDAARMTSWMRQIAAQESIRHTKLGRDVLPFAAIRNANLEVRQRTLREEDASEGDQLVAANERIEELEKQLAALASDQDYYIGEYQNERDRAEVAEGQAQRSAFRVQELSRQLKARGDDPDQEIGLPASWPELGEWCDKNLAGRLVLTPNAHRGTRKPHFQDVETSARCLLWLATDGRDQRINGGGGNMSNVTIMDRIQNASCGADAYDFDWNGRRFTADWHIKNGGNTRDPARCLRIYYCFDQQTQQIIVSDMPAHRRTGAT